MKNFYDKVELRIVSMFDSYMELSRKQYEYCPGVCLHPSEIHALRYIASASTINMTELARSLSMTRGGISKCIGKLEKMGLVRRYKYVKNQKEIYLHLTEKGVEAYLGHELYHAKMKDAIEKFGCSLTGEEEKVILHFLDTYLAQQKGLQNEANTKKMKGE